MDEGWITTRFHGHKDGTFTVQAVQDVEDILERNKALQGHQQKSDWGRQIASIPLIIIDKWSKEDGVNVLAMAKEEAAQYIKRKLADPDWRWLKTA